MRYLYRSVTFAEVPDEVSLTMALTNCPGRCEGCHSPELRQDIGTWLDEGELDRLLAESEGVTCVCFLGGDADTDAVFRLARHARDAHGLRTAWYSGRDDVPSEAVACMDYVKTGPYVREVGGLDSPTTNQRMYRVVDGELEDITCRLWKS